MTPRPASCAPTGSTITPQSGRKGGAAMMAVVTAAYWIFITSVVAFAIAGLVR